MNPAFAYFYDDFLLDKKFERELNVLEVEIANKNIGGRIARLGMFRNPKEMMEDLVRGGAKNIVVVGNDETLKKVIWSSTALDAVFGYLPLGKGTELAGMLGIRNDASAVSVLAGRYIEELDVGLVHQSFFLNEIVIRDPEVSVAIEGQFSVKPADDGTMIIRNLSLPESASGGEVSQTGKLEIVILPNAEGGVREKTCLTFERAKIFANKEFVISVDGNDIVGHSIDVEVLPRHLKFITGRRFMNRV